MLISLLGGEMNPCNEFKVNINNLANFWLDLMVVKSVDIDSSFSFKERRFISLTFDKGFKLGIVFDSIFIIIEIISIK